MNNHISKIKEKLNSEEKNIQEISNKYIKYIKEINNNQKSSSKNYFLIIDYINKNDNISDVETYALENLNNKFFKIKDGLARCGNIVIDINNTKEIVEILYSFINTRLYSNNNLNN